MPRTSLECPCEPDANISKYQILLTCEYILLESHIPTYMPEDNARTLFGCCPACSSPANAFMLPFQGNDLSSKSIKILR